MQSIPGTLIVSLIDLGLSNYEARIYAALVLFDVAEAKELVDFLGISKPSIYEGLDKLAEMGLAVKRNSKPAMYSPIHPEIAVKILMERHTTSAEIALRELLKLEQEKIHKDRSDAVWSVYGDSNINFKIRSMIRNARHRIECTMAERYLPLLEGINLKKTGLKLTVLSEDDDLVNRLKQQFHGPDHEITVVSIKELMAHLPHFAGFDEERNLIRMENFLDLIVDDKELLSIPPIPSTHVTGMNTSNKALIMHSRAISSGFWRMMTGAGDH
jgi:sugar-specific transcriptional regulator TrmB